MSGKRAKAIRRAIYGQEYSPRARAYRRVKAEHDQIVADDRRRAYQRAKREWRSYA